MKPYLYPYDIKSVSAKLLAHTLETICIRENGTYVPAANKVIVNWGSARQGKLRDTFPHLNKHEAVFISIDKLRTLKHLTAAGFSKLPKWTTDKETAKDWLADAPIIVRHKLRSSQGKGIEIIKPGEELPTAPLYTKLFPKDKEYRVHVFRGSVIDFAQKKLKHGFTPKPYIRSHNNGWIFCKKDVELPESVATAALEAVKLLGLDFGAVDLAISKTGRICVFEVNTAPGIEGSTVGNYAKAIKAYLEQLQNANNHGANH